MYVRTIYSIQIKVLYWTNGCSNYKANTSKWSVMLSADPNLLSHTEVLPVAKGFKHFLLSYWILRNHESNISRHENQEYKINSQQFNIVLKTCFCAQTQSFSSIGSHDINHITMLYHVVMVRNISKKYIIL